MKNKIYTTVALVLFVFASCKQHHSDIKLPTTADTNFLQKLIDGNNRFASLKSVHPDADLQHMNDAAKAQHPFAVVVCCSDSRLSPELIFDQGIGDLFVIRTAGNIISNIEMGSIEYAVEHLEAKLIVVMGHENCGAVKAFVEGGEAPGHIKDIVDSLKEEAEIKNVPIADVNRLDDCVRANVMHGVQQLQTQSLIIKEKLEKQALQIVGARYDLHDFKVAIIKQ
jgi:carbonic anhydrase